MAKNIDCRVQILLGLGGLVRSPAPSIYVLIWRMRTIHGTTFQGFSGRLLTHRRHFWLLLFMLQEPWAPLLLHYSSCPAGHTSGCIMASHIKATRPSPSLLLPLPSSQDMATSYQVLESVVSLTYPPVRACQRHTL